MKFLLVIIAMLALLRVHAQDTTRPLIAPPAPVKKDSVKASRKRTDLYREAFRHVRRKFDSTLFTTEDLPTTSDYAEDLERVYQLLTRVPMITESFSKLP